MTVTKSKPYRILRNLRIDEVSSVDRGAGEGVKVMLMKRDDSRAALLRRFNKIFGVDRSFVGYPPLGKNLDVSADPDGLIGGSRDDDDDDDVAARVDDEPLDDAQQRLRDAMKGANMQTMKQKLAAMDPVAVCKAIASEDHAYSLSEAEVTSLVQRYAKRNARAGESDASAFARVFTGKDDISLSFRKAVQIAKYAAFDRLAG